ncbi:MAG: hypothetical protein HC915_12320 [Anaerolineae bacterium]|nr:hypothetical protein [Anaerolineae bacterium]
MRTWKGWAVMLGVLALATPLVNAQTEPQPNAWDLRQFDQPGQITLYDAPPGASTTGKPVEIGDFNGNGCGDVAMTGHNARGAAGQTRILFDLCEGGWGTILDAAEPQNFPPGVQMITLLGKEPGDMLGTEVYHADFNGDGYDDLLVSAQNNDGPDLLRNNGGAAYILFGSADLPQQTTIDLKSPPENLLTIYGADPGDRLGMWVEGGDFDGDGYPDALIGANQADGRDNSRANAGEVWVVFGGRICWPRTAPSWTCDRSRMRPPKR